MQIPIVLPDQILTDQLDYLLTQAWSQHAVYDTPGGKFILPVPEVQIVG